jgi:hypothetical protein
MNWSKLCDNLEIYFFIYHLLSWGNMGAFLNIKAEISTINSVNYHFMDQF